MTTETEQDRLSRIRHTGLIRDGADLDAWVKQPAQPMTEADIEAYRRAVDEVFGAREASTKSD